MSESFNPYRKWLGIPEQDQPANHYRLLGVELFESDPDVIANAADGRMAQLKNYQAGKYSQDSQRILNEIAAAKICLLNPAKRAEYDRQLKQSVAAKDSNGNEMPDGANAEAVFLEFAPRSALSSMPRAGRRWSRWQFPLILAGVLVLLIGAMAFWPREDGGDTPAERARASSPGRESAASPQPSTASEPSKPATPKEPVQVGPPVKPAPDQGKKPEKPEEPPAKQPPSEPVPEKPVPPVEPKEPIEPEEETPPPESAAGPKRLAVPSEAEQQAAEVKIREIFGREFATAKTADQKLELAAKLSKQGLATADNSAVRYVLLRMAGEWTAGAGELGEALDIVDRMRDGFDMDALGMKADLLAKAVEANRSEEKASHIHPILDAAMTIMDEAVAADEFETASRAGRLAVATARAAKDPQLARDMTARLREADRLKLKYSTVKKAIDSLAVNPADADANLAVGQWRCFTKGDWAKGLPLLRKGSDANLAKLAEQDLAQPKEAADQIALADAWWALSESEQGPAKTVVQTHAAHWYKQVLPRLSSIDKLRVNKRLELLASASATERQPSGPPSKRGVIEKGNVALANNGTKVSGGINQPQCLIDGVTNITYQGFDGVAWGTWPCEWTITFNEMYRLREIRFRLWDQDKRYYNYAIAVSSDGKTFTPLVDRSNGQWASWQQIQFPPRPVKAIKLIGLHNSKNKYFSVIEFEAYCIPPERSRK